MITYVNNIRPKSIQSKHLQKYKQRVEEHYSTNYIDGVEMYTEKIYTKIIYIYKSGSDRDFDIDNVSKPIIDIFKEKFYIDDKIVVRREAIALDLDDFAQIEIDYAKMSKLTNNLLIEYLSNESVSDITFLEVGNFDVSLVKVGEEL